MLLNIKKKKNDVTAECQVKLACHKSNKIMRSHLREEWVEKSWEGISSSIVTLNIHP